MSSESQSRLSSNYTGWRPNRYQKDNEKEKHRLARAAAAVIGKLTPDNFSKLLPKIKAVYATINNATQLESFISMIFRRAIMDMVFHQLFVRLLTSLVEDNDDSIIMRMEFKTCVLSICDCNFQMRMKKQVIPSEHVSTIPLAELYFNRRRALLISLVKFIATMAANTPPLLESVVLIKYLRILLAKDSLDETNIEAACAIFPLVSHFIRLNNENTIKLNNAEKDTIAVDIKSHLLAYGYIRRTNDKVPRDVMDCCIGYYDTNSYFRKYYQQLQSIGQDTQNYSTRIRMLIQNISH
eukprot:1059714_1